MLYNGNWDIFNMCIQKPVIILCPPLLDYEFIWLFVMCQVYKVAVW